MKIKVVAGGILEKDERFLLVQENKKECRGKWCVPAGRLDDAESLIDGAKREIFEETGCKVEITGLLEIINDINEDRNLISFIFDTKIISEEIKADGKEILNVKWFSYEEIMNMKDKLRTNEFLYAIRNKMNNKIQSLDVIKTTLQNET